MNLKPIWDSTESSNGPVHNLSDEEIHSVLSNTRRRELIELLQNNGSEMAVRDLSERIAANESNRKPAPRKIKQSVYISMLQTHLPKLHELGVIAYDDQQKTVRVDGGMDDITVFLETVPKYGISWSEYYSAISLLGILIIFGTIIKTPVLSSVSVEYWGIGFLSLLSASGLYQTLRQGETIFHRLWLDGPALIDGETVETGEG